MRWSQAKCYLMKPCHAVALALVGWYLMIPPLDRDNKPETNIPLSEYWQHQAYDSAKECEASKTAYQRLYLDRWKKNLDKMGQYWQGMTESLLQGFCVESTDPRLKGK